MSRRVFDVGLDMGRIRNGLKHNHTNKDSKRSKSYRSTKDDSYIDHTSMPSGDSAMVPILKHQKSSPTMGAARDTGPSPEIVQLPSNHQTIDPDFPVPPSNHQAPQEHTAVNGERSLHSSQLYPTNGIPDQEHQQDESNRHSDNGVNFDLKPPPPNSKVKHIDTLSEQLFSGDHLRMILKDPSFFLRFTAFLNRYRPQFAPVLVRYLEAQKAIKAVEYANALAETIRPAPGETSSSGPAASVDPRFDARAKRAFDTLVTEALPAYVTNTLTKVVTESMVREITGTGMPVMRELVGGLAEVFCLADPSIKDCPIVYASEEFYRTTRYSRDDVLGRNCRFLQGPRTNRASVQRIGTAIKSGQEICETVLNYRRDGSPFMNLLLTAPLYDNRGSVRYFIGAQIDVSGLIEDGRGLDSFERLLAESRPNRNRDSDQSDESYSQKHLRTLSELGQMLSLDEASFLNPQHSRTSSMNDNASSIMYSARGTLGRDAGPRRVRRVLGHEDEHEEREKNAWALSSAGPSGKLPGVYQNYLLVRPYPSLRIIFVSPALRIPGLLQSPFLSRIGGPTHVRTGLAEAFEQGAAVTAKVTWLPQGRSGDETDAESRPSSRKSGAPPPSNGEGGRTRYISCTPLLGSDDAVGVWMVVMVENEPVTGSLHRSNPAHKLSNYDRPAVPPTPSEYQRESTDEVGDDGDARGNQRFERSMSGNVQSKRQGKVGSEGGRLYAEFMRNGGVGSAKQSLEQNDYLGAKNSHANAQVAIPGISMENRFEEVRSP